MLPVVALVGRQNVGKSTLFNRLTQSRDAIVAEVAGLTRDRQYGQANIHQQQFIVIDTAGLTDDLQGIDKLAIEQSSQAVAEADVVVFLVDGREGLTSADIAIANDLRNFNKRILLTVNKTEGLNSDIVGADYFQLGFGEPVCISAAHGGGIADLIDAFEFGEAPVEHNEPEDSSVIKLALIGRPNVGKSTLTNRMLGEERVIVFDEPGTTRDSIYIPLTRQTQNYILIDTAGIRRRGRVSATIEKFSVIKTLQAITSSDVIIYLLDAREGVTDQDLRLLGFIVDSGKAIVIAINKWDGMTDSERDTTKASIDRKIKFLNFAKFHFISALHGSGVGNLFVSVNEAFASARKPISTSKINTILTRSIAAHTPPIVKGRRIKLRYAHLGGHKPPLIIIHGNQLHELPEAYKRYLVNCFQEQLRLVGTPIRIEFKNSENPFKDRTNVLSDSQQRKKTRMIRHAKKQKR